MNITVYLLGIALQGLAAAIALAQIRRAPHKLPWLLVAISSLLIVIRRSATMSEFLKAGRPMAAAEVLTLAISALFFAGVLLMSRMFDEAAAFRQELLANQRRLSLALDASKAGIWEWDLATDMSWWSPEVWPLFGLSPDVPASYKAWRDSICPEDREQAERSVRAAVAEGTDQAVEWRVVRGDGEIAWIMSRGKPIRDAGGTVRKYLGVAIDITTRKRAEQAMAEQERMQATLLHNLPGFVYRCRNDRDWRMTFLSGGFPDVTGYHPDEILENRTRSYNDLILPEYREPVWRQCQEALSAHRHFELNYPIRSAGGEVRWMWERGQGVFDTDGDLLFLEGYVEDDTERIQAIEQLRTSQERLALATKVAEVGVWDWNIPANVATYSDTLCNTLGYASGELEPLRSTWESRVHPDDLPDVMRILNEHLEGKKDEYQTEHRLRHKSGRWVWVLDRGRVVERDIEGRPIRAVGTHVDLTARKLAESHLQLEAEIFHILSQEQAMEATVGSLIRAVRASLGCDAAGIRLRRGEDYPYWAQEGFPPEFVQKEDSLACIAEGVVQRDGDGRPMLECTCGLVLTGRTDPNNPLFTPGGSCWTNDSTAVLNVPCDQDPRLRPRNRCIAEGYRTVAMIPLRSGAEILGLLQLNFREAGALAGQTVKFLEGLAAHIGATLARRRAEEAYRESRAELGLTLESIGDGVYACDSDWRFVYINSRAEQLLGVRREEVIGKTHWEVFPLTQGTRIEQEFRLAAAGENRAWENFYEPWGRWFDNRCYPRKGGGVIVYFQEITARKQAEMAFREAEVRRQAMFDLSPDGMILAEPGTGRILEFNEVAHQSMGYTREEFAGMTIVDLNAAEPPEQTRDRMQAILLAGHGAFEATHRTKQGALRFVEVNVKVLELQGHQMLMAILRDVTEHRETEQKLLQSQKMEAIGRLAGGVAHDFRNQLTVIQGFGEMLARRGLVADDGQNMLQEILKAAERSTLLTGQLLAFSRKQVLDIRDADLAELVRDIGKGILHMVGEDVNVQISVGPGVKGARVDRGQFQQAIINLVTNARDAMPWGGGLRISVASGALSPSLLAANPQETGRPFVAVAVTDTGCGMDEAVKARVFEPFFTTKEVGQGTGLGLPMVYGFVKQSGGYVDLESAPGEGATFTLYFPGLQEGRREPEPECTNAMEAARSGETILLVEDDPAVQGVMAASLQEAGYSVVQTASATEAYEVLRRAPERIHLLLTDVVMPGSSGLDLVEKVKQLCPGLPVLFMSGYPERDLMRRKVKFAPGRLLAKPLEYRLLLAKVREFLDAARPGEAAP